MHFATNSHSFTALEDQKRKSETMPTDQAKARRLEFSAPICHEDSIVNAYAPFKPSRSQEKLQVHISTECSRLLAIPIQAGTKVSQLTSAESALHSIDSLQAIDSVGCLLDPQ